MFVPLKSARPFFSPSLVEGLLKQWLSSISVLLPFVFPRPLLPALSHLWSWYFSSPATFHFLRKLRWEQVAMKISQGESAALPVDLARQESWLSLPTNQKQTILSYIDRTLPRLPKALVTLAVVCEEIDFFFFGTYSVTELESICIVWNRHPHNGISRALSLCVREDQWMKHVANHCRL